MLQKGPHVKITWRKNVTKNELLSYTSEIRQNTNDMRRKNEKGFGQTVLFKYSQGNEATEWL